MSLVLLTPFVLFNRSLKLLQEQVGEVGLRPSHFRRAVRGIGLGLEEPDAWLLAVRNGRHLEALGKGASLEALDEAAALGSAKRVTFEFGGLF